MPTAAGGGVEAEPNMHDRGWYENEVGRRLRLTSGNPAPDRRDSRRRYDGRGPTPTPINPDYR